MTKQTINIGSLHLIATVVDGAKSVDIYIR